MTVPNAACARCLGNPPAWHWLLRLMMLHVLADADGIQLPPGARQGHNICALCMHWLAVVPEAASSEVPVLPAELVRHTRTVKQHTDTDTQDTQHNTA